MALPATIHKATIDLSDSDRGAYDTLTATVARHPSETEERTDQPFPTTLVQRRERAASRAVTITGGGCYVTTGETTLETTLRRMGR